MNEHIEIGYINTLEIDRDTAPGLFLKAADGEDVLLPNQYKRPEMKIGDLLEVFIYSDSEDRLVATTDTPAAMRGEFAFLPVVDTAKFGAFLDWGLPKDLFVPKSLQKRPFKYGEKRIVYLIKDEHSNRLVGSERLKDYLKSHVVGLYPNSEVSIMITAKTPLGFKAIVNNTYEGLLFHNEIFEAINIGDKKTAYVKTVRKDGKLDLVLQALGVKKEQGFQERVISLLQEHKGSLPYNYKSDADEIQAMFSMSKKNFKRTLTQLLEAKRIRLDENGIYLNT